MIVFNGGLVLLALVITQVSADTYGEDLQSFFAEELQNGLDELQNSLEKMVNYREDQSDKCRSTVEKEIGNLVDNAKDEVANTESCKDETEEVLNMQVQDGLDDLMSCINLTKSVYDGELLTVEIIEFGKNVTQLISYIYDITSDCQSSSFFNTASCVIKDLIKYTRNFVQELDYVFQLIDRVEKIANNTVTEFTDCVQLTVNSAGNKVKSIFKENCGVDLPEDDD